MFTEYNQHVLT